MLKTKATCNRAATPVQTRCAKPSKPAANRAQIFKYLSRWDELFAKWGWANNSEAAKRDLRHSVVEDLFGGYIRPSEFTRTQWDIAFYALDILDERGILVWSKDVAAEAAEDGARRVYLHLIERVGEDIPGVEAYGAPNVYIAHVARDKFGLDNWRALDADQLQKLFWTLKARVRKAANDGRSLYKETPPAEPAAENCPF